MIGKRTMIAAVLLALLSISGIIGMLLVEGIWDSVFFLLAALPLPVGALCWSRYRVENAGKGKSSA